MQPNSGVKSRAKSKRSQSMPNLGFSGFRSFGGEAAIEASALTYDQFLDNGLQILDKAAGVVIDEAVNMADKIGMSKLEPIFRLVAYVIAGIDVIHKSFNKTSHLPYKEEVDKLVNMFKRAVYKTGLAVTEILGWAAKFFNWLANLLPNNKVFGPLKKFAETISKTVDIVYNKIKGSLQKELMF